MNYFFNAVLSVSYFICLSFLGSVSFAGSVEFPGKIDINTDGRQAIDVLDSGGTPTTPEKLTKMLKAGVDISKLNPQESDLWKNSYQKKIDPRSYTLGIPDGSELEFINTKISVPGEFRFIGALTVNGVKTQFQFILNKKVHNILLNKALLEKIGYQIEPVEWLSKVRLKLRSHQEIKSLLQEIHDETGGDPQRWITSQTDDENIDYLDLQDLLVVPANPTQYAVEFGYVTPEEIRGRRVMNSLLAPYVLTDIPESVNLYNWVTGRIADQSVIFDYEYADWFFPTFQDIQWIVRKIGSLTETDFQEIVQQARFPKEVSSLTLEKIKSRRNSMIKLFNLEKEFRPLKYNPKVSDAPNLVNGKIINQDWPGYASHFAIGDPTDPLNTSEIWAFVRSKGVSSLLNSAVNKMNTYFNNNKNVQQKVSDHVLQKLVDTMISNLVSKQNKSIPFGMYAIPTWFGNILPAREVVVGSYMGTDNRIQIADSLSFQVQPGAFIGMDGLPKNVSESAGIGLQRSLTYTHIHPIKSIQAVQQTPWKNLLIPLLQRRMGHDLDFPTGSPLADDLVTLAEALDKDMSIGDSLIITDSVSTNESLSLTLPTSPSISLQTKFAGSQLNVHRLHIYKKDQYSFQIYDDRSGLLYAQNHSGHFDRSWLAMANTFSNSWGVNVYGVPVLNISYNNVGGELWTGLYTLQIGSGSDSERKNRLAEFQSGLVDLRNLFFHGSVESLMSHVKPYLIGHGFSDNELGLGFFFWHLRTAHVKDRFQFESQNNNQMSILYRSTGEQTGKDYTTLAAQMLTSAIQRTLSESNVTLDAISNGNPGDTFEGSASTRQVIYEAVQENPRNPHSPISSDRDSEFVQVLHTRKGWNISKDKFLQVVKDFESQLGFEILNPTLLNDTRNIELYNLAITINIYKAGLLKLAQLPEVETRKWFSRALLTDSCQSELAYLDSDCAQALSDLNVKVYYFMKAQKTYLASVNIDGPRAADQALNLVDMAEVYFPGAQLLKIIGIDNAIVTTRLTGFRTGDENGDQPINGYTYGSYSGPGPLSFIQNNLNVIGGEFFINWLINPL